jgi:hypothetical protein
VVVRRVITQANNRIIFIFSLGSGKVSKVGTVAAVTDRRYIQNYSTVLVWIVCWSHITRRVGTSLWGITLLRPKCGVRVAAAGPARRSLAKVAGHAEASASRDRRRTRKRGLQNFVPRRTKFCKHLVNGELTVRRKQGGSYDWLVWPRKAAPRGRPRKASTVIPQSGTMVDRSPRDRPRKASNFVPRCGTSAFATLPSSLSYDAAGTAPSKENCQSF